MKICMVMTDIEYYNLLNFEVIFVTFSGEKKN